MNKGDTRLMRRTAPWALLVFGLAVAGCAPAAPQPGLTRARLEPYVQECTARHGYNPEATSDLGPHALGKGEREWRECVYRAVEAHVIPKAYVPDGYRRTLAADREMTERIAAGQLTRAERRARIQALLEELDRQEADEAGRRIDEAARRERDLMRMREIRSGSIRVLGH